MKMMITIAGPMVTSAILFVAGIIGPLTLTALVLGWAGFITLRNHWVYTKRQQTLHDHGVDAVQNLIEYDDMMYRFWCWDIEKLKKQ